MSGSDTIVVGRCKCGAYGIVFDEETEKELGRCHDDLTSHMSWEDFIRTDEPVDRAELRWFKVDGYLARVSERRAIYHVNTPWKAHPWGREQAASCLGAPFVNQWACEELASSGAWRGTGRSNPGWKALVPPDGDFGLFRTMEAAVTFCKERLAGRIEMHERDVKELRERLEELE